MRYQITKFHRLNGKRSETVPFEKGTKSRSVTFTRANDDKAKKRFIQFCRRVFALNSGAYAPTFFGERKIYDGVYDGAILRRLSTRHRIIDEVEFRDFNPSLF